MEGDYSTVDEDTRISLNERLNVEGNYSTVNEGKNVPSPLPTLAVGTSLLLLSTIA
jgi:hypothetical protein